MRRSRRGAQAVEFALLTPVLLALLSGIVDLGEYLFVAQGLVSSVGAGARAGAVTDPRLADPLVVGRARGSEAWTGRQIRGTATFTATYAGGSPDRSIVVTGEVPFTPWFGLLPMPDGVAYACTVRTVVQP